MTLSPASSESPVLDAGTGPVHGRYLASRPENVLWGRLPCAADAPVARVDPGEELTIDPLSHEGILEDQGRDPERFFAAYDVPVLADAIDLAASDHPHTQAADGPHVVSRPIAVSGARPGDLLAVTITSTVPRVPYGIVSNRHAKGALPGEFPADDMPLFSAFAALESDGETINMGLQPGPVGPDDAVVRFPAAPFPGILGVAVPGDARPHSTPPGRHGGNLDIRLLTTGATLYLPVLVPDALFYLGDPHFAQGDGEVALTAVEASLRVGVRLDVVPAADASERFGELVGPLAETTDFLVPTGLDEDLDVAVQQCVRAAVSLLVARYGMHPAMAYAYLSAATDFDISQVVDVVKGVHARIRKADFAHLEQTR